ncbi:LytR/AlgR family response regulator transcription factor [Nitrincola schmidtii]|uniref:LytR/AlgR family response regulator transcription factor n=1 Tax=Nitrincola schmidtii TaxID=1730894 RepID=UPI00124CD4EC|nr:LytTR family DNA-binding domain-containing protein [Nitrincola schmidtii]
MNFLIVDDEPLALSRVKRLLVDNSNIDEIYVANNVNKAVEIMDSALIDVVVLDIAMPGKSGLDFARLLKTYNTSPAIIFLTAHPEYALESFDCAPVDYLLKPVNLERLNEAIERAVLFRKASLMHDQINFIFNIGNKKNKINIDEIVCCLADEKYVRVFYRKESALVSESLNQLEEKCAGYLLRVHRNALINPTLITVLAHKLGKHYVELEGFGQKIEVSRRRVSNVKAAMNHKFG